MIDHAGTDDLDPAAILEVWPHVRLTMEESHFDTTALDALFVTALEASRTDRCDLLDAWSAVDLIALENDLDTTRLRLVGERLMDRGASMSVARLALDDTLEREATVRSLYRRLRDAASQGDQGAYEAATTQLRAHLEEDARRIEESFDRRRHLAPAAVEAFEASLAELRKKYADPPAPDGPGAPAD